MRKGEITEEMLFYDLVGLVQQIGLKWSETSHRGPADPKTPREQGRSLPGAERGGTSLPVGLVSRDGGEGGGRKSGGILAKA